MISIRLLVLLLLLALSVCSHLGSPAAAAAATTGTTSISVDLQPKSKWLQCIDDGRLNVRWSVHSNGKLHSGLQLPKNAEVTLKNKGALDATPPQQ